MHWNIGIFAKKQWAFLPNPSALSPEGTDPASVCTSANHHSFDCLVPVECMNTSPTGFQS